MATVCPEETIDSNSTGLRIAEEVCLKMLPDLANGDPLPPIWYPAEPNSYSDFGGNVNTVQRNPINPTRQRRKGAVTGLEANGGFNTDVTQRNLTRIMQGILYADAREKPTTAPLNLPGVAMVEVADGAYGAAAGLGVFKAGDLVLASGFATPANNGLKLVTAATATTVSVAGLADEDDVPAEAKLVKVGQQFAAGDLSLEMSGNVVRMASAAVDFTTVGLIPGEWLFVGGDNLDTFFGTAQEPQQGIARIGRVTSGYLELDKVDWVPESDAGAAKTIQLFFGTVIQTESNPDLIKRRSYQLERTLGKDSAGLTMSEYLVGAVANEFTLNVAQEDKVTADINFIACDVQQRTGVQGVKAGLRPDLVEEDAYNTSNDFSRIKMSVVDNTASSPVALFAYVTDLTVTVNNNASPVKAVGVLGAIGISSGTIEIGGSQTAYFTGVEAVQAVRNNESVTLDLLLVKNNAGLLFDLPLITLGNGRLNVEADAPITLPLDNMAAQSKFGTSMMYMAFDYLPNAADRDLS